MQVHFGYPADFVKARMQEDTSLLSDMLEQFTVVETGGESCYVEMEHDVVGFFLTEIDLPFERVV